MKAVIRVQVCIHLLSHEQMAAWPQSLQRPSWSNPWKSPNALSSVLFMYWVTDAQDLQSLLQPYVTITKSRPVVAWGWDGRYSKEAEETFGSDGYFQYFDCGDGLWVYIYINLSKYILPLCQLYLNKAVKNRHSSFYCSSLYFTTQMLSFFFPPFSLTN